MFKFLFFRKYKDLEPQLNDEEIKVSIKQKLTKVRYVSTTPASFKIDQRRHPRDKQSPNDPWERNFSGRDSAQTKRDRKF